MWEKIEELGLEFHVSPLPHGRWSAGILWNNPPFEQVIAQDSKALIVHAEGESLQKVLTEAGVLLIAWLNAHKEVNK